MQLCIMAYYTTDLRAYCVFLGLRLAKACPVGLEEWKLLS